MIIINKAIKEALVMNDYIKILKHETKCFEEILKKVKSEDLIKNINEILLIIYKHIEASSKKMNECGVIPECEGYLQKFSCSHKINVCSKNNEFELIIYGIDTVNYAIKRIYEFIFYNKDDVSDYIMLIEECLKDLEVHNIILKELLKVYY